MKRVMFIVFSLILMSGKLFANGEEEQPIVVDEVLELTIFESSVQPFDDDYPVFLKAAELTNVKLKGVVSKNSSDITQSFNLMVAAGDMADIVQFSRTRIHELALEGAFVELDDLINDHAPNLKAFLESNPDIKKHAKASDGKIYSIPFIPDGAAALGWFVRNDWLKKLGLKQPKNVDQLYTVLKAFKTLDPNGNGKEDEIPYFSRDWSYERRLADLSMMWDAHENWYLDGDEVKFGPMEPEYKTAYDNLAKWYDEGLIDQEFFTRGKTARDYALKQNVGGMTHDWFGSTSGYNYSITDIEGFEFIPFAPPANINGVVKENTRRSRLTDSSWAISSLNENPIETIKYFDFFFTEEGRRLMNFGIEGETYTMVDGKPILMDSIINSEKGALSALREYGSQLNIGYHQDFEYEKQWMSPIAKEGVVEYIENDYFAKQFPVLQLTPEEKTRFSELMVAIKTLVDEARQEWILGAEDVNSGFDDFVDTLIQYNIEEAIAIQQAAYDRFTVK